MSSNRDKQPKFGVLVSKQVADEIRAEIINGQLKPGARINLEEYRRKWGISITPLRDAMKLLETSGLVDIQPRRGVFVATVDIDELREVFQIRRLLEPFVTELATPLIPVREAHGLREKFEAARKLTPARRHSKLAEIDADVHELVIRHCPNGRLVKLLSTLQDAIVWCQKTVVQDNRRYYEASLDEHIAICAAIESQDPEEAARVMREHLEQTERRSLEAVAALAPTSS